MIRIENLRVRFGGVTPLDGVDLSFTEGTCGLIGPNGAGKTTFFNVLSGFVTPIEGTVEAFGQDLLAMPDFKRARWGVRRTFQTEQAVQRLSAYDNIAMIYEHSEHSTGAMPAAVRRAMEFVGLEVDPRTSVGVLGARDRRLVELARAVVGRPRLLLLDEPAAGLPDSETAHMGRVIKSIPDEVGATVILVDHDMNLVRSVCATTAVLDFGRVIASGLTERVLTDPNVVRAYLGEEA
jgi:branched-chain amino acid transport system ATP-binding protein